MLVNKDCAGLVELKRLEVACYLLLTRLVSAWHLQLTYSKLSGQSYATSKPTNAAGCLNQGEKMYKKSEEEEDRWDLNKDDCSENYCAWKRRLKWPLEIR